MGRIGRGTAFGEPGGLADKVEDISADLVSRGFSYSGKDFLTSGITGAPPPPAPARAHAHTHACAHTRTHACTHAFCSCVAFFIFLSPG